MALSTRQIEAEKRVLWTRQNALQAARPLILCDPEFSWREIIPESSLECNHSLARHWEHRLRKEIFWGEKMATTGSLKAGSRLAGSIRGRFGDRTPLR